MSVGYLSCGVSDCVYGNPDNNPPDNLKCDCLPYDWTKSGHVWKMEQAKFAILSLRAENKKLKEPKWM